MSGLQLATVWETVADTVPAAPAVVEGDRRLSWRDYEQQAARVAGALAAHGVGPGDSVALYLYNGVDYLLAQFAAMKLRGVPVNVNYRYLDDELAYLVRDSDARVLVYHSSLGARVARVRDRLPEQLVLVEVDDAGPGGVPGALAWAKVLAHEPAPRVQRSADDLYVLYTGGTTGMPKGVMYQQGSWSEFWLGTALLPVGRAVPADAAELADAVRAVAAAGPPLTLVACPLMHGTGMWLGVFLSHVVGGGVVLLTERSLDCAELWRTVERERATRIVIVGDAFARPMLRELDSAAAAGRPYDLSSLEQVISSGVMWSAEVKAGLLRHADLVLVDTMGSTEGGMAVQLTTRDSVGETGSFQLNPAVRVLTDDDRDVVPGSGEAGMVATPALTLGYRGDPDKTARTIREIDGVRYVFPGDWATVEADGSIRLLGRGSQCINSGGEKIFPEEVEEAVKAHPAVEDCLVVGIPDERFGAAVIAVAAPSPGGELDEAELREFLGSRLAHYKLPRRIVVVDRVQRAPNGKADYPWAREVAAGVS